MTPPYTGTNQGSIQLSTVSNTVEIGETWTINESAIMYIRPKTVTFTAQGLKPNTQYYPFFNNVDISSYCSMVNGETSSIIKSDSIGSIVGNFYIPAATFTCGTHTFKLVDNVKVVESTDETRTVNVADPQYGSTEAFYEASGLLKQQQKMITTLTVIDAPLPDPGNGLPVIPDPKIIPPDPPVIVYPPPQIPEPILPPFTVNPPIPAPKEVSGRCGYWYFEYNVTYNAVQPEYTVPSQNPVPPTVASIIALGSGIVNSAPNITVSYIKSEKISDTQWNHVFSISAPVTNKFRYSMMTAASTIQASIGSKPTKAQFDPSKRPSGLPESAQYNVINTTVGRADYAPWVFHSNGSCSGGDVLNATGNIAIGYTDANKSVINSASKYTGIVIDPLAQSFKIEPSLYPFGLFTTSIAVYFKRVDQSCPVILELREMVNGFPGSNILPGGKVILPGTTASQSDNATIPTIFSFDQPVYLSPNTEFCFVLKSPSLGYDAWCSRFGDIDVITGKVIDEQPFVGVLFKSANDSTWTPNQYEDIKFDLNMAEFDNSNTSIVTLQPQKKILTGNTPVNLYYDTKQSLPLSYITTTNNSNVISIYSPMHGLLTGDRIYIGDFPELSTSTINGLDSVNIKNTAFTIVRVDEDNITITLGGVPPNKSGVILIGDSNQTINTTPIDNVFISNYNSSIPFINSDNKSLSVLPKTPTTLTTPTPPLNISNNSFDLYTNILINELMVDYLGTELPGTSITENVNNVSGNSSAESFNQYYDVRLYEVDNNKKFITFNTPRLFVSGHNEQNIPLDNRSKNGLVSLELKSNDKHISPVIDLNGMSVIVKTYKIDNQSDEITDIFNTYTTSNDRKAKLNDETYNSEIASGTGKANAKYKSKVVNLDNASINKRISIFLVGNCPSPAIMDVYVRLSNDANTHIDRDWIWVPLNNPRDATDYTVTFTNSINSTVMSEWYFEYLAEETFTVFDIKVVMRSTNNSIIPKIYGIRAITNES